MRVQSRVSLSESVALEHVEHRGLASVVEAEEDDVRTLLEKAEPLHGSLEEINNKHFL